MLPALIVANKIDLLFAFLALNTNSAIGFPDLTKLTTMMLA
jgi:hypothetical protein